MPNVNACWICCICWSAIVFSVESSRHIDTSNTLRKQSKVQWLGDNWVFFPSSCVSQLPVRYRYLCTGRWIRTTWLIRTCQFKWLHRVKSKKGIFHLGHYLTSSKENLDCQEESSCVASFATDRRMHIVFTSIDAPWSIVPLQLSSKSVDGVESHQWSMAMEQINKECDGNGLFLARMATEGLTSEKSHNSYQHVRVKQEVRMLIYIHALPSSSLLLRPATFKSTRGLH